MAEMTNGDLMLMHAIIREVVAELESLEGLISKFDMENTRVAGTLAAALTLLKGIE